MKRQDRLKLRFKTLVLIKVSDAYSSSKIINGVRQREALASSLPALLWAFAIDPRTALELKRRSRSNYVKPRVNDEQGY